MHSIVTSADYCAAASSAGSKPILARYLAGSALSGSSQCSQQMNTSWPATLTLIGAPIVPNTPPTGQIFCLVAASRSAALSDAKLALIISVSDWSPVAGAAAPSPVGAGIAAGSAASLSGASVGGMAAGSSSVVPAEGTA